MLRTRQYFQNRSAENVICFQTGYAFEGRVDRQKTIINRLSLVITNDLMQSKSFQHFTEGGFVILLCLIMIHHVLVRQGLPCFMRFLFEIRIFYDKCPRGPG
ncbi:MAG: hypothetical protein BWX99_00001 [Deltaproteobacteria bacterium ADurb.Bin151]|nr:MAG: hypothetical protein BWX99_00001 [Deltaproteobacteria bacterium ADurb.Bin151]